MSIDVYQMASFSRSGETLVLRALSAHPDLAVVHQLHAPDSGEDLELFKYLKNQDVQRISPEHPKVAHRKDVRSARAMILKNAVWEHAHPFEGFILVRNPLAVIASARTLTETPEAERNHRNQVRRWGRDIDKRMLPFLADCDNTTAFCALFTRKMTALYASGLPIVRYEDFVRKPDSVLRRLVHHLGVPWDEAVLRSHELYSEGEFGHGRIKLSQPINTQSLHKYMVIDRKLKSKIYSLCFPIFHLFGYDFDGEKVTVSHDFHDRFKSDKETKISNDKRCFQ